MIKKSIFFRIKSSYVKINFLLLSTLGFSYLYTQNEPFHGVYSHGFGDVPAKAGRYKTVLPSSYDACCYGDACWQLMLTKLYGRALNLWNSCIGQKKDVETLSRHINGCKAERVIVVGESRGATTLLNLLASNSTDKQKIAGGIVDSPYDHMRNVIEHRLERLRLKNFIAIQTVENLLSRVCEYKIDGLQPINTVQDIPQDVPLLFICSRKDTEVPWTSSLALYKKLRERSHEKVHVLIFDEGKHGWLVEGHCKDIYRDVVHAFYKRYGLEYNEEYAKAGKQLFEQFCQPDVQTVQELLNNSTIAQHRLFIKPGHRACS